jgi:hypothetical protein
LWVLQAALHEFVPPRKFVVQGGSLFPLNTQLKILLQHGFALFPRQRVELRSPVVGTEPLNPRI